LVYLAQGYPDTRTVSKAQLTRFVRRFDPSVNDVQQARHLAMGGGWYIASGTPRNAVVEVPAGSYKLVTLQSPYPGFREAGLSAPTDWQAVKARYQNRCATCGSEDGKPNLHYPGATTALQQAHKDPSKGASARNILPQCGQCNRAYRNYWGFDHRGRVVALANPRAVARSGSEVQRKVYRVLYRKFKGDNPLRW
jgi:hypothetical protein